MAANESMYSREGSQSYNQLGNQATIGWTNVKEINPLQPNAEGSQREAKVKNAAASQAGDVGSQSSTGGRLLDTTPSIDRQNANDQASAGVVSGNAGNSPQLPQIPVQTQPNNGVSHPQGTPPQTGADGKVPAPTSPAKPIDKSKPITVKPSPLNDGGKKDTDSSLVMGTGIVIAVLILTAVVAFVVPKFLKQKKRYAQPKPSFGENDHKLLELAKSITTIYERRSIHG